jgi:hypothetical protein
MTLAIDGTQESAVTPEFLSSSSRYVFPGYTRVTVWREFPPVAVIVAASLDCLLVTGWNDFIPSAGGSLGPQGKSEDQPHAKQIAPAKGVTPPAEVGLAQRSHSAVI